MTSEAMRLRPGDALFVVDLQRDFCPGGALAVAEGDKIVPLANALIEEAGAAGARVVAVRDWHPPGHASFQEKGGPWPPHCVRDTDGARFHPDLRLPKDAIFISKGTALEHDQYSAFGGAELADRLRGLGVRRVLIVGLAQEFCVRETALDAAAAGFETHVRLSGTRPITAEGGRKAVEDLRRVGVIVEDGPDES